MAVLSCGSEAGDRAEPEQKRAEMVHALMHQVQWLQLQGVHQEGQTPKVPYLPNFVDPTGASFPALWSLLTETCCATNEHRPLKGHLQSFPRVSGRFVRG